MLTAIRFLFIAFFLLLILPHINPVHASYNPNTGRCVDDGVDTITYASICDANSASGPNNPPDCITSGTDIWTFKYTVCRVRSTQDIFNPDECEFNYEYKTATCNSADRCEGASTGGSGYAANGHVYTGHCRESSFDGINPATACPTGAYYKQCCSAGGYEPTTYCQSGICPAGQITSAGTTSCNTAPPPPPVTCSPSGEEYNQCGALGCNDGSSYPSNHSVHISVLSCSDGTKEYECTDNGVIAGQCGNPTSGNPPACSVTWTFSDETPPANSNVTVTAEGSTTPNWNGSSYSLDGGGWTAVSSGPSFSFSVNSGNPGPHSLRFSINNGSTVCSSQNSQTFITQSLNDGSTCTAISVNSGNPVCAGGNYPATVSFRNDGTSTWINSGSNPYRLGSQDPQDNTVWGTNRVNLPLSSVSPGNSTTFNFNVTAPPTQGTKSFNWQMVHEGIQWFGSRCFYNVAVSACSFTPSCTGTLTNAQTRTIRWDASVNPAIAGSYTYLWSGDASGTTQSVIQTYSSAGTKNATVNVTSGPTTRTANCSVNIPAAFDFNLTNGGNKTVARGSAVNNSVAVNLVSGASQSVSLSAFGFPSGVTHSFSPASCNPPCSSTLNMTASSTAATGSSTITVTGTAGSLTRTTSFILTVTAPPPGCGNGTCNAGESCSTCSQDCGVCPPPPPPPVGPPPPPVGPPPPGGCPWIQTTGGDVHSNTSINTPC